MRHRPIGIFTIAVLASVAGNSQQSLATDCWQQWSGNGHHYLAVYRPNGVTWLAAESHAAALGGHLASIGSAAENTFVFNLVSAPQFWVVATNPLRQLGPWLGGFQPPGTPEPLGGWSWSDGSPWSYTNWSGAEPNNWQGNQEDHLQFFAVGSVPLPKWNDLVGGALMRGYIVELTSPPPEQPADVTCDATVNAADIAAVLGAWGQTGGSTADVDGDGIVGPIDLSLVLAEFGWPTVP